MTQPMATNERFAPARRLWVLVPLAAACWPLGPFVMDRYMYWEGAWLNGVSLGAALVAWVWLYRSGDGAGRGSCAPFWLGASAVAVLSYALAYHHVPQLLGLGILALGVGFALLGLLPPERRPGSWGLIPLILLGLPIMPSVQYVFGYPLRAMAAQVASLWMGGSIEAVGTGLSDGTRTIFVDAPCSGLRMLWTALVLASASALTLQLGRVRTCMLFAIGVVVAVLGNACRATALFVIETRFDGTMSHNAVGLAMFVLCSAAVVWIAVRLRSIIPAPAASATRHRASLALGAALVLACSVAIATPFLAVHETARTPVELPPFEWPTSWSGLALTPTPVDPGLARFLMNFPGRMAEFRLGDTGQRAFLRWTPLPTRRMHTAEGCYRATGGRITPLPAFRDLQGHTWARFHVVRKDGSEVTVRQCYFAIPRETSAERLEDLTSGARSWPDASSWYWAAAKPGTEVEATLAVTVTEQ
jgi:exosortase/archaeosortase family protein